MGGLIMADSPWHATMIALFVWWFSTGIILWRVRVADNGDKHQHSLSVVLGLPLLFGGIFAFNAALTDATPLGTYLAFFAAVAIWGWIELAFLSGIITGPNRRPCPSNVSQSTRFWRAVGTIAWHEALLLATLVMMGLAAQDVANPFAFLTFAVLFGARILAKLNLFFGVPRINIQFLPRPLAHLASHFRVSRITAFFPFSVSLLTVASALLLERAINATTPGSAVGFALLTCLALLAVLEHWFMVLPLPDEKLWRWMMPARKIATPRIQDRLQEDPHGL
jgi:putative photosynthetic complex assembly protein 2